VLILLSGLASRESTVSEIHDLPIISSAADFKDLEPTPPPYINSDVILIVHINLDLPSSTKTISAISAGLTRLLNIGVSEIDAPPGRLVATVFIKDATGKYGSEGPTFRLITPQNQGILSISLRQNRYLKVSMNNQSFFEFSWSKPLGKSDAVKVVTTTDIESTSASISSLVDPNGFERLVEMILLLAGFVIACYSAIKLGSKLSSLFYINKIEMNMLRSVSAAIYISMSTTLITVFIGSQLQFQHSGYFSRNGIQLSSFAQFSDFKELKQISASAGPYSQLHSNYPPFALWVLRLLDSVLGNRLLIFMFLVTLLTCITLSTIIFLSRSKVHQFFAAVGTSLFCYPILFALDRGSSEVFLLFGMTLFILLTLSGKLTSAAIILGVLTAFKIYPILFLLIFIRRRRHLRNTLVALCSAATATVISAALLPENGISEISKFTSEIRKTTGLLADQVSFLGFNSSLSAWFHIISEYLPTNQLGISRFADLVSSASPLLLLTLFVCLVTWLFVELRPLSLTYLLILNTTLIASDLAFDYRLMLYLPAILLLVHDRHDRVINERVFSISLAICALLLSSHPIYFLPESPISLGQLLNFPVLIGGSLTLVYQLQRKQKRCLE